MTKIVFEQDYSERPSSIEDAKERLNKSRELFRELSQAHWLVPNASPKKLANFETMIVSCNYLAQGVNGTLEVDVDDVGKRGFVTISSSGFRWENGDKRLFVVLCDMADGISVKPCMEDDDPCCDLSFIQLECFFWD